MACVCLIVCGLKAQAGLLIDS